MQQEVENFKKVNMISREQFDTLTPEPPVDPNQEVPPGPPRFQQGKRWGVNGWGLNLSRLLMLRGFWRLGSSWGEGTRVTGVVYYPVQSSQDILSCVFPRLVMFFQLNAVGL